MAGGGRPLAAKSVMSHPARRHRSWRQSTRNRWNDTHRCSVPSCTCYTCATVAGRPSNGSNGPTTPCAASSVPTSRAGDPGTPGRDARQVRPVPSPAAAITHSARFLGAPVPSGDYRNAASCGIHRFSFPARVAVTGPTWNNLRRLPSVAPARPLWCYGCNGCWRASVATRSTPVIRIVRRNVFTLSR